MRVSLGSLRSSSTSPRSRASNATLWWGSPDAPPPAPPGEGASGVVGLLEPAAALAPDPRTGEAPGALAGESVLDESGSWAAAAAAPRLRESPDVEAIPLSCVLCPVSARAESVGGRERRPRRAGGRRGACPSQKLLLRPNCNTKFQVAITMRLQPECICSLACASPLTPHIARQLRSSHVRHLSACFVRA